MEDLPLQHDTPAAGRFDRCVGMPGAGNKAMKLKCQKCTVADAAAKIFAAAHQRQHPGKSAPAFLWGDLRLGC